MIWTQFKILAPSFAGYWVFLVAVLAAVHYMVAKSFPKMTFNFALPVTIATATVVVMFGNACLGTYQSLAIYKYQQANSPQTAQNGQTPAADGKTSGDPALQAKSEFLKIVEQLTSNPDQINDDVRGKLFNQYGKLFPKNEDKENYFKNIMAVYQCQKFFWEDALASYQAKKEIKSDARTKCEKVPGTFFNRDLLVTADNVKANNETINKLAAHKRLPAAEGKTVEVTEDMLRNALEKQMAAMDAVKKVFMGTTTAQK